MRIKIGLLLSLFPTTLLGAAYQIFHTVAYNNAAELSAVNRARLIIGGTDPLVSMRYTGQIGTQNGTTASHTATFLPYLSVAYRINPAYTVAFDITHPIFANIQFPKSDFTGPLVTDSIIMDTNYSPKLSVKISDHISLGLGFDANNISDAQLNFMYAGTENINKTHGWRFGWDTGIEIILNDSNFLDFTYYSKINFEQLTGYSQYGNLYQGNFSDNLVIPDTYILNLTHKLAEHWFVFETLRYISWSEANYLALRNSALGTYTVPLNYNDSGTFAIGTRYEWQENWSALVFVEYQTSPQSTQYRPLGLPASALSVLGGSIDHRFSQYWTLNLHYTYVFANPPIDQAGPPIQNGHMAINVTILDIGLTWKI